MPKNHPPLSTSTLRATPQPEEAIKSQRNKNFNELKYIKYGKVHGMIIKLRKKIHRVSIVTQGVKNLR